MISVYGEEWQAECAEALKPGDAVEVQGLGRSMRLRVRRQSEGNATAR
jgi:membrane-bound ClpP family serine protease